MMRAGLFGLLTAMGLLALIMLRTRFLFSPHLGYSAWISI